MLSMLRVAVVVIGGQMLWVTAHAQTQRSGGDAATRAVLQLQQVMADKANLQAEIESLKKELDEAKGKLTSLNAENSKLQQRTRELEAGSGRRDKADRQTAEELERTRNQMQELITRFRETAQNLMDVETDRNALRAEKEGRERQLGQCVDKNAQLYLLGREVLDQYSEFGVWTALRSKESFTRLTRTRLENLADEYRDRIDALRLRDKAVSTLAR